MDSTRTADIYAGEEAGTFVAVVYPWAVNYEDSLGHFQPIDNTLVPVPGPDPDVQNEANEYDVQFPPDLSDPLKFTDGDSWMTVRIEESSKAPRVVNDDTAVYPGAAPGVTASYTAQNALVKEDLVLEGPSAQRSFTYQLQMSSDLSVLATQSGGIDLVTYGGSVSMSLLPPFMTDASGSGNEGPVSMTLSSDGANPEIIVTADDAWLDAPDRVWPVTIDPTIAMAPIADCHLASGDPGTSICGRYLLKVGLGGGDTRRILLKFDQGAAGIPSSAVYQSATLGLYLDSTQTTTGNEANYSVHRLTHGWTSQASWIYYDAINQWPAPGGDFNSTAWDTNYLGGTTSGFKTWNITDLAQGWRDGTYSNSGLMVKQDSESVTNLISFIAEEDSSKCATPGSTNPALCKWPYLKVTYDVPPNVPDSLGEEPQGTTPVLHAVFADPDGGTGRVLYTVTDADGATILSDRQGALVSSGGDSWVQIPAGTLQAGGSYGWTARSSDGVLFSARTDPVSIVTTIALDTTENESTYSAAYSAGAEDPDDTGPGGYEVKAAAPPPNPWGCRIKSFWPHPSWTETGTVHAKARIQCDRSVPSDAQWNMKQELFRGTPGGPNLWYHVKTTYDHCYPKGGDQAFSIVCRSDHQYMSHVLSWTCPSGTTRKNNLQLASASISYGGSYYRGRHAASMLNNDANDPIPDDSKWECDNFGG